ncbi:MBL fold metallo-hydrolase [Cupriavidus sp. USMAA2-4]|uniref:MBL fold metallo-hydrolase n=1 Tax=Cupriavidus malaysiensis TaxID=367825 RepID=A0ABM6FCU0_9BURK|nr:MULTISPECIES: quinoprotein relay system zinc metallohydrolase 1 [Cupriavidus]AOY96557.1 MBL fold metallo-hydrolase [Cupriavidus sp. USMAA2-4]AOZ03039.1 MBL fold metallo-hydrolase [Cupriavidus sp. USMAHM13]AOZ09597.1 MBL fold metallo-hydrolase [Cupriavidus malaysiensis]
MSRPQRLLLALAASACAALAATGAPAQSAQGTPSDYRLAPQRIAPDTWLIAGENADFAPANGCNIINTAFIDTGDGVVVVNTGPSLRYGQQQRRAIAAATAAPVRQVLNLNLHPDHFFGNQAWSDAPTQALPGTIAGAAREGEAYADNLYRLCGAWLAGTTPAPAGLPAQPGRFRLGTHELELLRFDGHTGDDLVLVDHSAGVIFAGGLVFHQRAPTTPHADLPRWLASLDRLEALQRRSGARVLVPSHGPLDADGGAEAIGQTRAYLRWLDTRMREAAAAGTDLAELIAQPVPAPFAGWAAMPQEYVRNLTHLYPAYERAALAD